MEDNYIHKGLRKKLIDQLIVKGIKCNNVLQAINNVPRHLFMDKAFLNFAYVDKAFPIGNDQTISQPFTVAFQTELLKIKKFDKVLEIGTGSGYQAAVLHNMKADVFTIERHRELYNSSKLLLTKLNCKCMFIHADGYKGLPQFAPFDKIIITCGAPEIPKDLLFQLKIGGRMVIPVGRNVQKMKLVEKKSNTYYDISEHGDFSFVPMLKNKK